MESESAKTGWENRRSQPDLDASLPLFRSLRSLRAFASKGRFRAFAFFRAFAVPSEGSPTRAAGRNLTRQRCRMRVQNRPWIGPIGRYFAMLSREQIEFFNENGYLRIPQVYTPDEVDAMRRELDQLVQDWATTNMGWSGPWRQVYMSPDVEKRSMLTHLHDLHFYSESWCRAVTNPRLAEAMADLLGPNVELHHTTLHIKPPETGMPFPLHADEPFYEHEGPRYVDAIIHLDDTN